MLTPASIGPPVTLRAAPYPYICPDRFRERIQGRHVLITGAGRGIGKNITFAFAKAGANITCLARTRREIEVLAANITTQYDVRCCAVCADVTIKEDLEVALQTATRQLGPIQILINNAALCSIGPFEEEPMDLWWRVMEVNVKGPVMATRLVIPGMLERGSGCIISICSRNSIHDFPYMTAYSASKTALLRFHRCLELEIKRRGVFTYALQPGDTDTTLLSDLEAVNREAGLRLPALQQLIDGIRHRASDDPELAGNVCVALAAGGPVEVLSGRYVDAQIDLEDAIQDARQETQQ